MQFHFGNTVIRTHKGKNFTLWAGLLLLAMAGTASPATWIVDEAGGPGVDFLDIPPALAAAASGDLVIVRDGTYSGFMLSRGITLLADTNHSPTLGAGSALISAIPSSQTAVVSGFKMYSCTITTCNGAVMLDDCIMGPVADGAAVKIDRSHRVNMSRCQGEGEDHEYGTGFEMANSTALVTQCEFTGSRGVQGYYSDGSQGSPAVDVKNSILYFHTSSAHGGWGGDGHWDDFKIFHGGDGAPGILLVNSTLELFGNGSQTVSGGRGGDPSNYLANYGDDANAVYASMSQIHYSGIQLETSSAIYMPPPAFGGNGNTIEAVQPATPAMIMKEEGFIGTTVRPFLHARNGWSYWLLATYQFTDISLPWIRTHLFLDPSFLRIVTAGTITSGNQVAFHFPIPNQPVFQGIPVHMQAYLATGTGSYFLSTPIDFLIR